MQRKRIAIKEQGDHNCIAASRRKEAKQKEKEMRDQHMQELLVILKNLQWLIGHWSDHFNPLTIVAHLSARCIGRYSSAYERKGLIRLCRAQFVQIGNGISTNHCLDSRVELFAPV